jgi:kynurenine formamidase
MRILDVSVPIRPGMVTSPGDPTVVLLGAGVVTIEGLDLRGVEPGKYQLVCAPLKPVGSDGAPARVLLIQNEGAADG